MGLLDILFGKNDSDEQSDNSITTRWNTGVAS